MKQSKLKYTTHNIIITKSTIKNFITPVWARQISNSNVNKIFSDLKKGIGLHSVFALNKKGNKYIVIDGNHRKYAIKKFFETYKFDKVPIQAHIYNNLNDNESREIWNIYEKKKQQSKIDKIKLYVDEIPVLKKLLKDKKNVLYYTGYSKLGNVPIVRFFESYVRKNVNLGEVSPLRTIKLGKELKEFSDCTKIRQLINDYKIAFDEPNGNKNFFYTTTGIYIITKIYFYALEKMKMKREKVVEHMKNLRADTALYAIVRMTGNQHCKDSFMLFVNAFNRRLKNKMPYFLQNIDVPRNDKLMKKLKEQSVEM